MNNITASQLRASPAGIFLILSLAAMPVAIMTGNVAPSIIYYGSLILALWLIIQDKAPSGRRTPSGYMPLLIAMGSPTIVVVFASAWNGFFSSGDFETSSRILLGSVFILYALQRVSRRHLSQVVWGFAVAGLVAAAYIFYLAWPNWERPYTTAVYNAVIYGNLVFVLAITVFLSAAATFTRWPKTERALKLAIAAITFFAFVMTQTRTTWLALPFCIVIAAVLFTKKADWRRVVLVTGLLLAAFASVYASSDALRSRATLAVNQVVNCHGEGRLNEDSLCIRLQLWRASLQMAKERPVAGLGDRKLFTQTMQEESVPAGIVTPKVARWLEPHSDLMMAFATFGVPGGVALLLVYLFPAIVFTRRLAFGNPQAVRSAAAIGLAVCVAFIVAGFGDTMFRSMRIASFYAMTLAVFLRLSEPLP